MTWQAGAEREPRMVFRGDEKQEVFGTFRGILGGSSVALRAGPPGPASGSRVPVCSAAACDRDVVKRERGDPWRIAAKRDVSA